MSASDVLDAARRRVARNLTRKMRGGEDQAMPGKTERPGARSASAHRGGGVSSSPTFPRVVQEILASGITQRELAKAVGASVRTVQTWGAGDNRPTGVRSERLLDVRFIVQRLAENYTEDGIRIWLQSRNARLDMERPIVLLERGEIESVLHEVETLTGGW